MRLMWNRNTGAITIWAHWIFELQINFHSFLRRETVLQNIINRFNITVATATTKANANPENNNDIDSKIDVRTAYAVVAEAFASSYAKWSAIWIGAIFKHQIAWTRCYIINNNHTFRWWRILLTFYLLNQHQVPCRKVHSFMHSCMTTTNF